MFKSTSRLLVALIVLGCAGSAFGQGTIPAKPATSAGVVTVAGGGTGNTTATDDALLVGNGTALQLKVLTTCTGAGKAVTYDTSTNAFGCNTISGGGSPGGSDTQVQFNSSSAFAGNAAFTYDVTNHAVKVNNDFYASLASTYKYGVRIGANDGAGYGARLTLESDSNDASNPGITTFSSQGTMASPGVSGSGDVLFARSHTGYDSSDFAAAAFETVSVSGTVSAGIVPGKVEYGVIRPNGSNASMTIDGNIPSAAFNVPVKASGYLSSDGTAGVTGATCSAWKNGLCVTN